MMGTRGKCSQLDVYIMPPDSYRSNIPDSFGCELSLAALMQLIMGTGTRIPVEDIKEVYENAES